MKILIIEDEHYAAKRLVSMVKKEIPEAEVLEVIDSVEDAISWFSSHVEPDLVFMDIQLADGLSFQIFDSIKIKCPIIFTTAFDEYALDAFKVNSIDYLLKPIETQSLSVALSKYLHFFPGQHRVSHDWKEIAQQVFKTNSNYKKRFLVKSGNSYSYVVTEDIRLIYSEDGLSFCIDSKAKRHHLDQSIEKIAQVLDPSVFFRVNRKVILALESIKKIHSYFNNRLKLEVDCGFTEDIIVSRERVKEFKKWIDS